MLLDTLLMVSLECTFLMMCSSHQRSRQELDEKCVKYKLELSKAKAVLMYVS